MRRDKFMDKCIAGGLAEKDADVCYLFFNLSGDVKWSLKKALEHFSDEQIEQVVLGFANRLTVEEVDCYFKPKFSAGRMSAMRSALLKGLDLDDLEEIYQDGFSCQQTEIACEYKDLVPDEIFQKVYQPCFDAEQMQFMFRSFKEKEIVSLEELESVAKVEYPAKRMALAVTALRQVGIKKAELIQNPYLGAAEILELICAIKHGVKEDIVKLLSSCMYDAGQLCQLRLGAENGLSLEQLKLYMDPEYDAAGMKARRLAIEQGITANEFEQYFHPLFSKVQTDVIVRAFLEGLPIDAISLIADCRFTAGKMAQALYGFTGGLSIEEVRLYYKSVNSEFQMKHARLCLVNGVTEEHVRFLLIPELTDTQVANASLAFRNRTGLKRVESLFQDYSVNCGRNKR